MLDTSGIAILASTARKVPRTRTRTARARVKALSGMFYRIDSVLYLFVGLFCISVRCVRWFMSFGADGSSLVCRARSQKQGGDLRRCSRTISKFIPEFHLGVKVRTSHAKISEARKIRPSHSSIFPFSFQQWYPLLLSPVGGFCAGLAHPLLTERVNFQRKHATISSSPANEETFPRSFFFAMVNQYGMVRVLASRAGVTFRSL